MKAQVIALNGNVWRSPEGVRVSAKPCEIKYGDKAKAAEQMGLIKVVELIRPPAPKKSKTTKKTED